VENFKKYKSQMRKWDQWRIKNNISTPEEINKENEYKLYPFTTSFSFVSIVSLYPGTTLQYLLYKILLITKYILYE
jgi:hypothetical protein